MMKPIVNHNRTEWLIPTGLITLGLVPVIGGGVRITQLAAGAATKPENARFFAAPLPVVLHILSVTVYAIVGAFQFVPGFRRRHRTWHRTAGRLLVLSGLVAALTGLWMTLFYPWPAGNGVVLFGLRLLFGAAMLLAILLGIDAIRRRDYFEHGNWMIRAYAIGMGAGTQVFTHLPWFISVGRPDELPRAVLMGAGWAINLAVAEVIIHRRRSRTGRAPRGSATAIPVNADWLLADSESRTNRR